MGRELLRLKFTTRFQDDILLISLAPKKQHDMLNLLSTFLLQFQLSCLKAGKTLLFTPYRVLQTSHSDRFTF